MTPADVTSALHVVVSGDGSSDFLFGALVLGDIIPIPIPFIQNVASIGDVFLSLGLGFFLFASVVRVPTQLEEREEAAIRQRLCGIARSTRLPRPDGPGSRPRPASRRRCRRRGARTPGLPRLGTPAWHAGAGAAPAGRRSSTPTHRQASAAVLRPGRHRRRRDGRRAEHHPPAALPGDAGAGPPPPLRPARPQRLVHRAVGRPARLAVRRPDPPGRAGHGRLVVTGYALATALVFVAAPIPNLLISPIAGTLRRSMGPQGSPDRQRPAAGGDRPADPGRHRDQRHARLPAASSS